MHQDAIRSPLRVFGSLSYFRAQMELYMERPLSIKVKGDLREHLSPRLHPVYSQQNLMLKEVTDICSVLLTYPITE